LRYVRTRYPANTAAIRRLSSSVLAIAPGKRTLSAMILT